MKECTEKDELYDAGASTLIELEAALEKYVGDKFQWEWRSVVGEDVARNPIWSLHLYVELKEEMKSGGSLHARLIQGE
jgi:hypothetical protein